MLTDFINAKKSARSSFQIYITIIKRAVQGAEKIKLV